MSKVAALRAMREAKHNKPKPTPGERIIESLKEAVEIAQGKRKPARSTTVIVSAADVAKAAQALGAKGGKSKSPAKQAAAKQNGKRGGKPKRLGSDV